MDTLLIVALAGAFALILAWALLVKLEQFREEMDYINMELARCSRASRKRWKREKRRLWLWLLLGIPRK